MKKNEIQTLKTMIERGHFNLLKFFLKDRIVPVFAYLELAEHAKLHNKDEFTQFLNSHMETLKFDAFNRPVKIGKNV